MSDLIADLIECARLLGATQAKKGIGCYTREDARFERAMHESISDNAKRLTAERDELRRQPAAAAPAAPQAGPKREPNPDEVICPACTHQFRAIQKERGTTSSANSRRRQHD